MEIHGLGDAGLQLTRTAQRHADDAAQRAVDDPSNPEALVDLERATDEAKIGARLLRAHDEMTGSLLDVLA